MNKYSDIFAFLKKRKTYLKKLYDIQNKMKKIEDDIKLLEKPFFDCDIDPRKYRTFFSEYHLSFRNDNEKYFVKDVYLTKDHDGNPFYEVSYEYVNVKTNEKHSGELSLRKFLHILDEPDCELKLMENK